LEDAFNQLLWLKVRENRGTTVESRTGVSNHENAPHADATPIAEAVDPRRIVRANSPFVPHEPSPRVCNVISRETSTSASEALGRGGAREGLGVDAGPVAFAFGAARDGVRLCCRISAVREASIVGHDRAAVLGTKGRRSRGNGDGRAGVLNHGLCADGWAKPVYRSMRGNRPRCSSRPPFANWLSTARTMTWWAAVRGNQPARIPEMRRFGRRLSRRYQLRRSRYAVA
jgi:hypothetical protein